MRGGRWSAGRFDLGLTFTKHSVFNLKGKNRVEHHVRETAKHTTLFQKTTQAGTKKRPGPRVQAACVLLRLAITKRFKSGEES